MEGPEGLIPKGKDVGKYPQKGKVEKKERKWKSGSKSTKNILRERESKEGISADVTEKTKGIKAV